MQVKSKWQAILFLSCFLLWLAPGCLYIPQGYRNIELSGKRIEEEKLNIVVPRKTTKAEFIEKVGQPYLMMDDFGVMAYYWRMLSAYVPWLIAGGGVEGGGMMGGVGEVSKRCILMVAYDDNGYITKYEKYETILAIPVKTVNERAIEWVGKGEILGTFTPVKIPEGKSVVYVSQPGGSWFFDDDLPDMKMSGVFIDGSLWAELKWGQYTPIVLPPGTYKIGVEPRIRAKDKFLDPKREELPEPSVTTTIDTFANEAYYLEIKFVRSNTPEERKYYFARLSKDEALQVLAKLRRAR